jgi:hypothetical protein
MFFLKLNNIAEDPIECNYQLPELDNSLMSSYTILPITALKEEVRDFFKKKKLNIKTIIFFKKDPGITSVVHSDIFFNKGNWELCHCSVNWNLKKTDSTMEWYDTGNHDPVYPDAFPEDENHINAKISGINFGKRGNYNVKLFTLLESAKIEGATLVDIGVPHVVRNSSKDAVRYGISIRFEENYTFDNFKEILST